MRFRPCIDLREGRVVQIVGGSLRDESSETPITNFETERSAADFAKMYEHDGLTGGHVVSLGPGNRDAALEALRAFPEGLQAGGGITPENASAFLEAGASHVIVTSYVFREGRIDEDRLRKLTETVGKSQLVLDLSCRRRDDAFWIVTDRWQKFTDVRIDSETLERLAQHCDEFLVHGVDVEGKMHGIQADLVQLLGEHAPIPTTYAGGAYSLAHLDVVKQLGRGRIDLTIGSALDIFGGSLPYHKVVEWQRAQE